MENTSLPPSLEKEIENDGKDSKNNINPLSASSEADRTLLRGAQEPQINPLSASSEADRTLLRGAQEPQINPLSASSEADRTLLRGAQEPQINPLSASSEADRTLLRSAQESHINHARTILAIDQALWKDLSFLSNRLLCIHEKHESCNDCRDQWSSDSFLLSRLTSSTIKTLALKYTEIEKNDGKHTDNTRPNQKGGLVICDWERLCEEIYKVYWNLRIFVVDEFAFSTHVNKDHVKIHTFYHVDMKKNGKNTIGHAIQLYRSLHLQGVPYLAKSDTSDELTSRAQTSCHLPSVCPIVEFRPFFGSYVPQAMFPMTYYRCSECKADVSRNDACVSYCTKCFCGPYCSTKCLEKQDCSKHSYPKGMVPSSSYINGDDDDSDDYDGHT